MVKLTPVEDDAIDAGVSKPTKSSVVEENDEDYEDTTESESESDEEDDFANETLYERITALKDIIPPSQRTKIVDTTSNVVGLVQGGSLKVGNFLWILSSSALLLLAPFTLAVISDQQAMEFSNALPEDSSSVFAPGAESALTGNTEKK